ncbi:hypothetical protein JGH11_17720 [Dysgonomonas sp. Marseille-P4677]|uniref:hypothetical protein n=1 Tax=Dysgonomonas sp. Marseille-P4677 TaxID=2364790 RepID=UPI0019112E45|nr:hypothetical protein [Dysgonomonas sp. Marseille-P4677]MBK5722714.1 hypothetical protein [Dysgonomonas sp. Marseille-P4677]
MKRYLFLILVAISSLTLLAQRRPAKENRRVNITTNIHGDLKYEDSKGLKATLSENIFGDKIYEDNRNNKVTYGKGIWEVVFYDFYDDEYYVLEWLASTLGKESGCKEEYKRNIHGDLQYESNRGIKASLSKNIFDDGIYKDSRGNEIKYSKEYWAEIMNDSGNNDIQVFFLMIDQTQDLRDYKEEYSIDIFGHQQFKNNQRESASLSKDIFDNMVYKDNKGNELKYTQPVWNKMVRRQGSAQKVFISLLHRFLFQQ